MCFSLNFKTNSYGLFVCLVVFFDELAFSIILRNKMIFFGRHCILCEKKKISASFQFWTDTYTDHIWREWYNGSYTMMAKPIKMLESHYPIIQFLIMSNISVFELYARLSIQSALDIMIMILTDKLFLVCLDLLSINRLSAALELIFTWKHQLLLESFVVSASQQTVWFHNFF